MLWLLNILIPGAGLIVRCREWLGFSLSVLFAICGNVAVAGRLIAPAAIPFWLTLLAAVLTLATWMLAQVLFWRQGRLLAQRRANGPATSELASDEPTALRA